MPIIRN